MVQTIQQQPAPPPQAEPEVVKSLRDHGALPQWRLMWRQFRKHRLALIGLIVLVPIYFIAVFSGFFAPAASDSAHTALPYAPPQRVHLSTEHGMFVYGYSSTRNQETFEQTFTVDKNRIVDVGLFVRGDEYKVLGLIPSDIHLIGPTKAGEPFFLLGADQSGRDLLSRLIHGARVSLSIGLVGVFASFILGILIGGISGYFGGPIDNAIQRVIEFIMSIPTLPLWMALSAALPNSWGPLTRYFAITRDPLADRLDRAGPRRPRPVPQPARGGLRDGGAAGRGRSRRDHLSAIWSRRSPATSSRRCRWRYRG